MWIIPQNYPQSSRYAQDMVASSEDLSSPGINIEQSLMWRSKLSPLRTWSQRWKRDSWFQHLCGRILKPCQHTAFETELMSSLAVIHASHFLTLGKDRESTIPTDDTSGHISTTTYEQLDLFAASSRTLRDTSALDSERSSMIWKDLVTKRRGEFSARLKLARLTRESGSISWATPCARDHHPNGMKDGSKVDLGNQVRQWPTPTINGNHNRKGLSKTSGDGLSTAAKQWPTPTASDSEGGPRQQDGKRGWALKDLPGQMWPTPTARDYKGGYKEEALTRKDGKSRRFDALPNAAINGQGTDKVRGHLSANWVEGLMGLPLGWTDLGKWGSSE